MSNIYYNPENYGLRKVDEIDSGGSYEFDTLCVWQNISTGQLYWAHDSGCSCPGMFEDYRSVADLNAIHDGSIGAFESEVMNFSSVPLAERMQLVKTVHELYDDFGYIVKQIRKERGIVDE